MIAILGKTCAGKDTVKKELIKMGLYPIVTYTTRPKRKGEKRGQTYHYINKFIFKLLKRFNFFAETTSYNVANGDTWYYGTAKKDLYDNGVLIVNPDGIREINKISDNVVSFFLDVSEDTIKKRLVQRGDNPDEASRRISADNIDFENIEKHVDYVLDCNDMSAYDIAKRIYNIYSLVTINKRGNFC